MSSPCSTGLPQKTCRCVCSATGLEIGVDPPFWSAPPCPTSQLPDHTAIQFSMIVEITSCAPVSAFSRPAMPAYAAPASVAAAIVSTMCSGPFIRRNDEPTHNAKIEPTRYWPWPPMLKRPQRKPTETARPQSTSAVVRRSVCCRFVAANERSLPLTHGKSQLSPLPSKIAR